MTTQVYYLITTVIIHYSIDVYLYTYTHRAHCVAIDIQ